MATLWIREYTYVGSAASEGDLRAIPVAHEPGVDQTPVTFTTATQSAAFGASTKFVEILGSAAFHYVVGANPTATTNAMKVPADTSKSFSVVPGQKLSVIAAA